MPPAAASAPRPSVSRTGRPVHTAPAGSASLSELVVQPEEEVSSEGLIVPGLRLDLVVVDKWCVGEVVDLEQDHEALGRPALELVAGLEVRDQLVAHVLE